MTATLSVHVSDVDEGLSALFEQVRALAVAHLVPLEIQREIHLALDEIVTNIIRHGYGEAPCRGADVEVRIAGGAIEIEVRDRARPFNPLDVPDPDVSLPPDMREVGGLGLYFVRQLMDSVEYRRKGDENCVRLTRRFSRLRAT